MKKIDLAINAVTAAVNLLTIYIVVKSWDSKENDRGQRKRTPPPL